MDRHSDGTWQDEAERAEEHWLYRDKADPWGEPVEANGAEPLSVMVSARSGRAGADQLAAPAHRRG